MWFRRLSTLFLALSFVMTTAARQTHPSPEDIEEIKESMHSLKKRVTTYYKCVRRGCSAAELQELKKYIWSDAFSLLSAVTIVTMGSYIVWDKLSQSRVSSSKQPSKLSSANDQKDTTSIGWWDPENPYQVVLNELFPHLNDNRVKATANENGIVLTYQETPTLQKFQRDMYNAGDKLNPFKNYPNKQGIRWFNWAEKMKTINKNFSIPITVLFNEDNFLFDGKKIKRLNLSWYTTMGRFSSQLRAADENDVSTIKLLRAMSELATQ